MSEPMQQCQVDGCTNGWPQSENWSGRWECDEHLNHDEELTSWDGDARSPQPVQSAQPAPRLAGTFAIYDDPSDGGLVLVADVDGQGVTRRKVPGAMVAMMTGGGGLAGKALRGLFGRE